MERALAIVRERLAAARPPVTWTVLWGDDDPGRLAAALADLRAPLLFGGTPGIVVRRAEVLSAATEDLLLAALPDLERGGHVVLVARTVDQRRKLGAALTRQGAVHLFPRLADETAARRWVTRLAAERGIQIAPRAVDLLVERSGTDLALLSADLDKAAFWEPGTRVEPDAVAATVALTRTAAVEELTDRLGRRDLAGASRALRELLDAGEPPVKVAAFLTANVRRVLHVAELADAGLGPDQIAARSGIPVWLVRKQLGRGRARDLEVSLEALRRLDTALKSSRPAAAVFEATLLEIARATAPRS